jgi:hypothetical protein
VLEHAGLAVFPTPTPEPWKHSPWTREPAASVSPAALSPASSGDLRLTLEEEARIAADVGAIVQSGALQTRVAVCGPAGERTPLSSAARVRTGSQRSEPTPLNF